MADNDEYEDAGSDEVNLDNLKARPMDKDKKKTAADPEVGFFQRWAMGWSSDAALGFQTGNRKNGRAPRVENPGYSFLEIFYREEETQNGPRRRSIKERWMRGYNLGRYGVDKAINNFADVAGNILDRRKYKPDSFTPLQAGDFAGGARPTPAEDAARFEDAMKDEKERQERPTRMDYGPEKGASTDRVHIYINPDQSDRAVGSNHVGPERQLRQNTDPWPLRAPTLSEAPERKALPAPEPKALPAPDGDKPKGQSAAERGAAAAPGLAARKDGAKSKAPKKDRGEKSDGLSL